MLEQEILDALNRIENLVKVIALEVEERSRKERDSLLKIGTISTSTTIRK